VYRSPEEVLSKKFLASLEGKPVTDSHPDQFLNSENANWYLRGHVQNVRKGDQLPDGEQAVIGDLVVTDAGLIAKIRNGLRELSVGYGCKYVDNKDGTFSQTRLEANHIAIVDSGRAGKHVRIRDNAVPSGADDFYSATQQYLGRNINEVAAQRRPLLERSTSDGVVAEMEHAARPRDLDELTEELTERTRSLQEEDNMAKKTRDRDDAAISAALERMTIALQDMMAKRVEPDDEEESHTAEDSPVLHNLRRLKPLIAASKDRAAIHAYNDAIRTVRALGSRVGTANLVPVSDRRPANSGNDFFKAVERARARMLGLPENSVTVEKLMAYDHDHDYTAMSDDEQWGRAVNRVGQAMREGKLPRK
jgi:hypothetical protein